jgi:hypothetical protein
MHPIRQLANLLLPRQVAIERLSTLQRIAYVGLEAPNTPILSSRLFGIEIATALTTEQPKAMGNGNDGAFAQRQ